MAYRYSGARSPYFVDFAATNVNSALCKITINSTLVYTLFKTGLVNNAVSFEVSELIRDYINVDYTGSLSTTPLTDYGATVNIDIELYASTDASGGYTGIKGYNASFYDGYTFFDEQDRAFDITTDRNLISNDVIWLPEDTAGAFYYYDADSATSGDVLRKSITTTDTSVTTVGGLSVSIKRFPCSRYDAKKLVFINRYGLPQELWFFGKTIESTEVKSDQYKSSNITTTGVYSKYEHQFNSFDVNGQSSYTLNSGFISEDYNEAMKELMLSERVWLHIDNDVRPVNVKSTNITYKTSLNDKLVEYSVELQQSNDLISTMR